MGDVTGTFNLSRADGVYGSEFVRDAKWYL